MGKGQHQLPTKEELIKKYDKINKIKQVDYHSHFSIICQDALLFFVSHPVLSLSQEQMGQARFLQNRNLNCIALCEGKFEIICTCYKRP